MGEPGAQRPRRLRRTAGLRRLVRETRLSVDQLLYPMFVVPGEGIETEIGSLPGQMQRSVDRIGAAAREVAAAGIQGVLLFGQAAVKTPAGDEASSADGAVQRAVGAIKEAAPELVVFTDVCLCAYTDHGHCGVLDGKTIDNDASVARIAEVALSHARAGADVVAPSDMMDGRVGAIRVALDAEGLTDTAIMAYAAKYASAFYGPFREASGSAPSFGDRRGYQMDPGNVREAVREVGLDLDEGADIVMVKPALTYLDVVARVRAEYDAPLAAYLVSGEFAAIKAAAERGWLDERAAALEAPDGGGSGRSRHHHYVLGPGGRSLAGRGADALTRGTRSAVALSAAAAAAFALGAPLSRLALPVGAAEVGRCGALDWRRCWPWGWHECRVPRWRTSASGERRCWARRCTRISCCSRWRRRRRRPRMRWRWCTAHRRWSRWARR